ncbi:NUDIX domain-containing protein [Meiothermus sp. CFH 77666]|nr:NUDIX domain-containing protein [Meiothermus sp. CFH 77666]MBO1437453.1 NUDIX domain-containing protein [Meiothermus sp. CFH 77666]
MREQKAAIHITKGEQLYVFRHADPEPGFQVPKGSIQSWETPLQAAVREVCEESVLRFEHLHFLGEIQMTHTSRYGEHWRVFWAEALEGTSEAFEHKVTGEGEDRRTTFFYLLTPLTAPILDWNMGVLQHRIPGKTTAKFVEL